MGDIGTEHPPARRANPTEKQARTLIPAASLGRCSAPGSARPAGQADGGPDDLDLGLVVQAWPLLTAEERGEIMAVIGRRHL
jgi:hypothetical protein